LGISRRFLWQFGPFSPNAEARSDGTKTIISFKPRDPESIFPRVVKTNMDEKIFGSSQVDE